MATLAQIMAGKPRPPENYRAPFIPPDQPFGNQGSIPKFFPRFPFPPYWMTPPGTRTPDIRNYITPTPQPRPQDRFNGAFAYREPWEPGWGRSGWGYGQGGNPGQYGETYIGKKKSPLTEGWVYGLHNWWFPGWLTDPGRLNPYDNTKGKAGRV